MRTTLWGKAILLRIQGFHLLLQQFVCGQHPLPAFFLSLSPPRDSFLLYLSLSASRTILFIT